MKELKRYPYSINCDKLQSLRAVLLNVNENKITPAKLHEEDIDLKSKEQRSCFLFKSSNHLNLPYSDPVFGLKIKGRRSFSRIYLGEKSEF